MSVKTMGLLVIGTEHRCFEAGWYSQMKVQLCAIKQEMGEWPSSSINCIAGYCLSYLFSNTHN